MGAQVNEARGAKVTLGYSFGESCIKDLESLHLGIFVMIYNLCYRMIGDDDDSSNDDEEEEASEEGEAKEEEEHLAPADSVVAPIVDHVSTEPFKTDESAATPPSPPACQEEVERLLALPPPSPLISLSPPSADERLARCLAAPALPSSPLPIVPHPYGSPNHVRAPPGFRAAMGRLRASSPSTHHPLHPLPPLPPPPSSLHVPPHVPTSLPLPLSPLPPLPASLFIPLLVDHREDTPEAELLPHKRLCLTALTSRYEVRESLTAAPRPAGGHGIDYGQSIGLRDVRSEALVYREAWHSLWDLVRLSIMSFRDTGPTLGCRITGHLAMALGEIQTLQARDQARADAPEGTASTAVGLVFSFLVSDNHNNMPPRRSSATARAAAAAAPMIVAADTEGVVVLSQWFEKMESVFHIINCATVTQYVAYVMDWKALKKMMTVKYCPRGEIKKLEIELWNLKESDEVEKYVSGLPDMIRGNVMSYQPKTMEKAIEFANDQMDQKVLTIAERQAEQKRKLEFNAETNQGYQQQNKAELWKGLHCWPGEKREYTRPFPLCTKCNYHHKGPCAPRCNKCKKIGHLARDYRNSGPNGNNNNRRNSETTQNAATSYECGVQGHFKRDCPKLKNKNRGNQGGNGNAPAKVYVVSNAGTNPDSNVVTGTFLLNNRYASILFEYCAEPIGFLYLLHLAPN
ncbi:reverse transcriptase domain-containing protein [Tanacetum coccineum]